MSRTDAEAGPLSSVEDFARVTAALANRFADRSKVLAEHRLDEESLARGRNEWRARLSQPGAESLRATFYAAYQAAVEEGLGRSRRSSAGDHAQGGARFLSEAQSFRAEAAAVPSTGLDAASPLSASFEPAPPPGALPSYLRHAARPGVKTVSTELPQPPPVLPPPAIVSPSVVVTPPPIDDDEPEDPRGATVRLEPASGPAPNAEPNPGPDETLPIPLSRQGMSAAPLPFGNRSTGEVRERIAAADPQAQEDRSGQTMGLDDGDYFLFPREVPFDGDEDDSLTLEQFASCQAELGIWPDYAPQILAKYGLADEHKRRSVTRTWERRATRDASLRARHVDLVRELREYLSERRDRGLGPP